MLDRFRLDCDNKRVARSIPRVFAHNYVPQVSTYIQDSHSSPSIKGKSRSVSQKRTVHHVTDSDHVTYSDYNHLTCVTSQK